MRALALLLSLLASLAGPALAQDASADKSLVENWLQDNLSGAGREVEVTGFEGALRSRATVEKITIADDQGVWFTLEGGVLDWTRSALLTGRLAIDSLTADKIVISRRPVAVSNGPQAAASDFSLPELPISVSIGTISARQVELGSAVLGRPAVLSLKGGGQLEGGSGSAELSLTRIDSVEGALTLAGSYANASRELALDLSLHEAAGGIVQGLTGLNGEGAIDLAVKGDGPLDKFTADIGLATDGAKRLAGQVTLTGSTDGATSFAANLAGDLRPVVSPDLAAFFGTETKLTVAGTRGSDGQVGLNRLDLTAGAVSLTGSGAFGPTGWPERLVLDGRIGAADGSAVRLPIGGMPTRLSGARFALDLGATMPGAWSGSLSLDGLARDDMKIDRVAFDGTGSLAIDRADGSVKIIASGLSPTDPALAQALGRTLAGRFGFEAVQGAPLKLTGLDLSGTDYGLSGTLSLDTDTARLDILAAGKLGLTVRDMSRFGPLAGLGLTGAAELSLDGSLALPGGPFDITITGNGHKLGIGDPRVDAIFAGASALMLKASRDTTGTRINAFNLTAPKASARASGEISNGASRFEGTVMVSDATALDPALSGAFNLTGNATQAGSDWQLALEATAPGATTASITGTATMGSGGLSAISGKLSAKADSLAPYAGLAGRALTGAASLSASGRYTPTSGAFELAAKANTRDLALGLASIDQVFAGSGKAEIVLRRGADDVLLIDKLALATPVLSVTATGSAPDAAPKLDAQLRLANLGLFVPGLDGPFAGSGTAALQGDSWQLSASGTGPGGTTVNASGSVAGNGASARLSLDGQAPLALANPSLAPRQMAGMARYALKLEGPLALASLSGSISTSDARLALPSLRTALDPIRANVRLAEGRATIDATAQIASGGQLSVSGPVSLAAPYNGDLVLTLQNAGLADPALFDTTASGRLALSGPLAGGASGTGRIALGQVELRVPETGVGATGALPGLTHVGEPAAVRASRERAGLTGTAGSGGGASYGLDVAVNAPSQIFLRGRGLDAEMGGSLRLTGTTNALTTQGGFSLIRGRLDILGKRLALTEGQITLEGDLNPYVHVLAETQTGDLTVRVAVDGRASAPVVTFSSSPQLPQDEILSQLIFGRSLADISPLQALKLAGAAASLAGGGSGGVADKLRSGFGLADLDVQTDSSGKLAVKAGTYITDNIYTDVTVSPSGTAEINLNLDITPNLTARGRADSAGNTGLGIFFEKDY